MLLEEKGPVLHCEHTLASYYDHQVVAAAGCRCCLAAVLQAGPMVESLNGILSGGILGYFLFPALISDLCPHMNELSAGWRGTPNRKLDNNLSSCMYSHVGRFD